MSRSSGNVEGTTRALSLSKPLNMSTRRGEPDARTIFAARTVAKSESSMPLGHAARSRRSPWRAVVVTLRSKTKTRGARPTLRTPFPSSERDTPGAVLVSFQTPTGDGLRRRRGSQWVAARRSTPVPTSRRRRGGLASPDSRLQLPLPLQESPPLPRACASKRMHEWRRPLGATTSAWRRRPWASRPRSSSSSAHSA